MSFFGMGPMELGIIVVVALLIFGPGKLPEVAGQLGRAVRDFRRMTSELTGEFEKTMSVADDIKKSVRDEVTSMTAEVTSVAASVKRDLNETTADLKATAGVGKTEKTETKPVKPKTTKDAKETKPATAKTVAIATKADPLADVSVMDEDVPAVKTNGRRTAPVPPAKKASEPAPVAAVAAPAAESAAKSTAKVNQQAEAVETVINGSANETAMESSTEDSAASGAASAGLPPDALARARQRRQAAGYNRRVP